MKPDVLHPCLRKHHPSPGDVLGRLRHSFLWRTLWLGLAGMALAAQAHANVFDEDDRRPLRAEDNFHSVGQISCEGSSRLPVGTLISHPALSDDRDFELVVTVAHAFRGRNNAMQTRCSFLPGGDPVSAKPVMHAALGTLDPDKAWHHDWAVAVIAGRLSTTYGSLALETISPEQLEPLASEGAHYALIGKNGERPRMLISRNCGPVPKLHWHHGFFSPGEFNHNCDMIAGWSGGPLVLIRGEQRHVIAINATELNGVIHKVGDPWQPRMFANTAIRYDGQFRDAVERMALMNWQTVTQTNPTVEPSLDDAMAYSVVPGSCPQDGSIVNLADLAVEIALVPQTQARNMC